MHSKGQLQSQACHRITMTEDLKGCSLKGDAPMVQHDNALSSQGVVHKMGHMYDGDAAGNQTVDDGLNGLAPANIKHGRRLVEQKNFGMHG